MGVTRLPITCLPPTLTPTPPHPPTPQGLLTGKYNAGGGERPTGPRAALFTESRYREVALLVDLLRRVGQEQGGKTPGQARARVLGVCGCQLGPASPPTPPT